MNILSKFLAAAVLLLTACASAPQMPRTEATPKPEAQTGKSEILPEKLPVLPGDFRVGYVDIERILRESAPAVKAGQKIEKEFAARDEAIKKLNGQVRDLQDYLEKKGAGLSNSERRNKERELSNLSAELQRAQREFREDLNQRKNEELSVLLEHANKAIQAIAESEKYDLVLQEAVYRNPKIDITDKVLKALANEK